MIPRKLLIRLWKSIPRYSIVSRREVVTKNPMTVADADMERFIHAVSVSKNPKYYLPGELTPSMCGRHIRIVGGPLDGYEGKLLTVRGSKTKRLLVELPEFFSVGVEVNPEYIRLL